MRVFVGCGLNAGMPTWSDLAADALTAGQLHDVLHLRSLVFVVEQECVYLDIDGLDLQPATRHVLATEGRAVVAVSRLLPGAGVVRIGRVVVAPSHRGTGLGRDVMRHSLAACATHWPGQPVLIAAQAHLQQFYGEFGFEVVGAPYDEDGIAHVDMRRA